MDHAVYQTTQNLHTNYFTDSKYCPQVSSLAQKTISLPLEFKFLRYVNLKTLRFLEFFLILAPGHSIDFMLMEVINRRSVGIICQPGKPSLTL